MENNEVLICDKVGCDDKAACTTIWFIGADNRNQSINMCRNCFIDTLTDDIVYDCHDGLTIKIKNGAYLHHEDELPEPFPKGQELFSILLPILTAIIFGIVFSHWMRWI